MNESRILVTAATQSELDTWGSSPYTECQVTGVGIPETFCKLFPLLQVHQYRFIINIGIAGAYPGSGLSIGDIGLATEEVFADIGMELNSDPDFMNLGETDFGSFYKKALKTCYSDGYLFKGFGFDTFAGRAATVNSCTGTDSTGLLRESQTGALFETMEGAAVVQLAQQFNIPMVEIRAISNQAAKRDMQANNIKKALANLNLYLMCFKKEFDASLFHSDFTLPQ